MHNMQKDVGNHFTKNDVKLKSNNFRMRPIKISPEKYAKSEKSELYS